ncbi:hypothetical protein E5676_scaffold142G00580 [Cucumis melo var. makuwa]|uniref:Uncharacterized protein n=1 Tax=Cucumis melo var. makuwa TaxID=1194695 RepID=A0A5D3DI62_CUCMM|nr:hypothetical protein E6C27_scaffold76G001400 [Cucumis melo var. makuwa]TYK23080.1 hypothetical protein E5676_scaffold142G00580 [Cucumis melo var. makuwa]
MVVAPREKVSENVVKEEKGIASVPPISKNEIKASRPMTKEVEVTNEPSKLPIQLKYILIYAKRVMVDGSSFSFQLPSKLFGIPRKSYVLQEDVIDFCNMQKVKDFINGGLEFNSPFTWMILLSGMVSYGISTCCVFFGITRLICASDGITRQICVSDGITKLICTFHGITRLMCASYEITRLLLQGKSNARGKPARGKKDS